MTLTLVEQGRCAQSLGVDEPRHSIQSVGTYLQMPTLRKTNREAYAFIRKQGLVRPSALEDIGIPRANAARWASEGLLVRVARGLYALPKRDFGEHDTLVQVAKLVPEGIVCLLSALRFHELTTQNPSEVWLGIERKARKPKLRWPPLHIVWWSGAALTEGIIVVNVAGVSIRATSPARTVADCFKYRNKIGLDIAVEALRDFRRKKMGSLDELHRMTNVCRVARVVQPYLEAMT